MLKTNCGTLVRRLLFTAFVVLWGSALFADHREIQHLPNGDFEQGDISWTKLGSASSVIHDDIGCPTGTWCGKLDSFDLLDTYAALTQEVTIPIGWPTLRFEFEAKAPDCPGEILLELVVGLTPVVSETLCGFVWDVKEADVSRWEGRTEDITIVAYWKGQRIVKVLVDDFWFTFDGPHPPPPFIFKDSFEAAN